MDRQILSKVWMCITNWNKSRNKWAPQTTSRYYITNSPLQPRR